MNAAILNISAYRFVGLTGTAAWRERIHREAERRALLGTVLIAEEGINLALAGPDGAVRDFLRWLEPNVRSPAWRCARVDRRGRPSPDFASRSSPRSSA